MSVLVNHSEYHLIPAFEKQIKPETVVANIRRFIRFRGWSYAYFAEHRAGMTRESFYQKFGKAERKTKRGVNLEQLLRISDALGVRMGALFFDGISDLDDEQLAQVLNEYHWIMSLPPQDQFVCIKIGISAYLSYIQATSGRVIEIPRRFSPPL